MSDSDEEPPGYQLLNTLETSDNQEELVQAAELLAPVCRDLMDGKDYFDEWKPRFLKLLERYKEGDIAPVVTVIRDGLHGPHQNLALDVLSELLDPQNCSETDQNDRDEQLLPAIEEQIPNLRETLRSIRSPNATKVVAQLSVMLDGDEPSDPPEYMEYVLKTLKNAQDVETKQELSCSLALIARAGNKNGKLVDLGAIPILIDVLQPEGVDMQWIDQEQCPFPHVDAALVALVHICSNQPNACEESVLKIIIKAWKAHALHEGGMGVFSDYEWVESRMHRLSCDSDLWQKCGGDEVKWYCL